MYTKQQQLEYLHKLQTLHKVNVLKDDIHLTYIYRNKNKAVNRVHTLQDKIQSDIATRVLNGDWLSQIELRQIERQYNLNEVVDDIVSELLQNERKRIHNEDSKFIDHVVQQNTEEYSNFLSNRLHLEAERLQEKVIVIEGSALENGATPAEAKQAVNQYLKTHGKARTKNIVKDAMHSQEVNVDFIKALDDGWRYKIWCNGNKKNNTRAWHIAKNISPVPIDEPFTIAGPYGIRDSMFPGDLNSGAENVANCKCYLRYSNSRPSGLRQTTFNIPTTSYLNNDNSNSYYRRVKTSAQNLQERISSAISDTTKNIKTTFQDVTSNIKRKFKFRR